MKKKKNFKKRIIIAIIVVVIIAGIVISKNKNQESQDESIGYTVEKIEKRTIVNSISTTGNVDTVVSKDISSTLSGSKIKTVNVKKGDYVNVGDVICTFDTSSVSQNLSLAKQGQNIAVSQATISANSAQKSVDDLVSERDKKLNEIQSTINSASSALDQANTAYNAQATTLNATITTCNSNIADLNTKLESLKVKNEVTTNTTIDSSLNTNIANVFEPAEATYTEESLKTEITANQTKLTEAKNALSKLESAKSTAQSALNSANDAYSTTADTYNKQITSLQDTVSSANLGVQSAAVSSQSAINAYAEQLSNGTVKSTVSGTVTSINVKTGDIYMGTAICTIEGCNDFIVKAEIDEYDIPDVKEGMEVLIKTDATRDEELKGVISFVSTTATQNLTSTKATYSVEITLDEQNDRLRTGMNAKISIITDKQENVLSVPYDAVQTKDDGTKYIEVSNNEAGDDKYEVTVTTGIEGSYYVEVESNDLNDNLYVIVPEVESGSSLETLIDMMGSDAGI